MEQIVVRTSMSDSTDSPVSQAPQQATNNTNNTNDNNNNNNKSHPPSAKHEQQTTQSPPNAPAGRKVNRSCLECTRRKVKCDGAEPCRSCVRYRCQDACVYRQRSKRHAVSRSTFDKATEQLQTQARILAFLFPGLSLDEVAVKSEVELRALLGVAPGGGTPPSPRPRAGRHHLLQQHPHQDHFLRPPSVTDMGGSAAVSENGDAPADRRWEELPDQPGNVANDDVNAMGLVTDDQVRSYLGMTSMSAVIRAIFRLWPAAKEHTAQCSKMWSTIPGQPLPGIPFLERDPALNRLKEQRCIDFYFDHIHAITPFIDEEEFRQEFSRGTRQDASWQGLVNMVFVLGSIASGSDSLHEGYYRQARSFIGLESLGAGNLESLQALCLLGGYYLHYRNSPNMAYSVLGAAHRVAIALGLHREPRRRLNFQTMEEAAWHQRKVETRRRTWWSLFCLDTWGAMTQGRPTCGRWDSSTMDTLFPTASSPDDYMTISLQVSSEFCLVCDRMQQRFARSGRLSAQEVVDFDTELVHWYQTVPPTLTDPTLSPPRFLAAREFMRTRYLNARMLLTRSSFLYIANGHRQNLSELTPESRHLLNECCSVASQTIDAIALYWTPNRFHVWNANWYLFQACMAPLLALAVDKNMPTSAVDSIAVWRANLGKALETFAEMRPWMKATDHSPDIISALYEAMTADYEGAFSTPSGTGSLDLFGWYDDQLAELDWSTFLGGENITFQSIFPTP
ncbi:Lactose regulatory protein-like protein [Emericellopsis cladophorae]|uniref:Lactose regulatory protein-like protein n=1 Tax=Emericellopsis cladophorae TaxID=2686198 RepID=A0A9P9Y6A4_9HYPO|nr:Lactose regulatory protein-like protein [Emericellopsis cladophorae]KAI6783863.1 Lactose regulatory protein-like protein [Emericellopsis cladophorae]